jgi:hypothetical protein
MSEFLQHKGSAEGGCLWVSLIISCALFAHVQVIYFLGDW